MRNIQTYIENIDLVIHYDNVHLPYGDIIKRLTRFNGDM